MEARRLGSGVIEGDVYLMLVRAASNAGHLEAAARYLDAFDVLGGATMSYSRIGVVIERAGLLHARGETERARALMYEALLSLRVQEAPNEAWSLIGVLAHWGVAHDDPERNLLIELSAVTAYRRYGDPRAPSQAAAWRAAHPDLAAGTDTPLALEDALKMVLEGRL